jgi:hypothetical protein
VYVALTEVEAEVPPLTTEVLTKNEFPAQAVGGPDTLPTLTEYELPGVTA